MQYVGTVTFQETVNSGQLVVPLWDSEPDQVVREWEGANNLLPDFLASFRLSVSTVIGGAAFILDRSRQIQDRQFPDLYLTEIQLTPGRSFSKLRGTFKGVINGRKPKPIVRYGKKPQQVTLPFIGDELGVTNGISASFIYQASWARYEYLTKRKPRGPLFKGKIEFAEDPIQITSRTGAAGDIKFFKGRTLTSNQSNVSSAGISGGLAAYNAVVECINEDFDVQPAGAWWQVAETNQITITPLDLAQSGWVYQLA